MAHAARSNDAIPRPPMSRPNFGLLGWVLFGLAVAAALAYGFLRARGPALVGPGMPLERPPGGVRVWSSLSELGSGRIGPTVTLADVPTGTGVIGIGSLSELRGEIAIVRGQRWVAYAVPGNGTRTQKLDNEPEAATFLAVADIRDWQAEPFSQAVSFDSLPDELDRRAAAGGLDRNEPIPVLIDGPLADIRYDVVNGPSLGDHVPTDQQLAAIAIRDTVPASRGTLVGFYAKTHGERLIHAGERLHLHVVLPAEQRVGHVDWVSVEPGATLRLPRVSPTPPGGA